MGTPAAPLYVGALFVARAIVATLQDATNGANAFIASMAAALDLTVTPIAQFRITDREVNDVNFPAVYVTVGRQDFEYLPTYVLTNLEATITVKLRADQALDDGASLTDADQMYAATLVTCQAIGQCLQGWLAADASGAGLIADCQVVDDSALPPQMMTEDGRVWSVIARTLTVRVSYRQNAITRCTP